MSSSQEERRDTILEKLNDFRLNGTSIDAVAILAANRFVAGYGTSHEVAQALIDNAHSFLLKPTMKLSPDADVEVRQYEGILFEEDAKKLLASMLAEQLEIDLSGYSATSCQGSIDDLGFAGRGIWFAVAVS